MNPGGRKTSQLSFQKDKENFRKGDFSPPQVISYWTRTDPRSMAIMVKDLYGQHIELLKDQTVAFPVCFFRSRSWDEIPRPTRQRMRQFCFPIVNEIIQKLQPKRMLVIGSRTRRYLDNDILGSKEVSAFNDPNLTIREGSRERLYEESKWETEWGIIPILATIHLTGGHGISSEERRTLRERFHHWLGS